MPAAHIIDTDAVIVDVMFAASNFYSRITDTIFHYSVTIPTNVIACVSRAKALRNIYCAEHAMQNAFEAEQVACEELTTQEIEDKTQQYYFSTRLYDIQHIHYNTDSMHIEHTLARKVQEYVAAQQLLVRNTNATNAMHKLFDRIMVHTCATLNVDSLSVHARNDMFYIQLLLDNLTQNRFHTLHTTLPANVWSHAMANEMLQLLRLLADIQCNDDIVDITHIFHKYTNNDVYVQTIQVMHYPHMDKYKYFLELQNIQIHKDTLSILRALISLMVQVEIMNMLHIEFLQEKEEYLLSLSVDSRINWVHTHSYYAIEPLSIVSHNIVNVRAINVLYILCLPWVLVHYGIATSHMLLLENDENNIYNEYVASKILLYYDDIVHRITIQIENSARACVILYMLRHNMEPTIDSVCRIYTLFQHTNTQLGVQLGKKIIEYTTNEAQIVHIIHTVLLEHQCDANKIQMPYIQLAASKTFCYIMQQHSYMQYGNKYTTSVLCSITYDLYFVRNLHKIYEDTKKIRNENVVEAQTHDIDALIGGHANYTFRHAILAAQKLERRVYSCLDTRIICHEAQKLKPQLTFRSQLNVLQAMHMYPEYESLAPLTCLHLYIDGIMVSAHVKLTHILYQAIRNAALPLYRAIFPCAGIVSAYYMLHNFFGIGI